MKAVVFKKVGKVELADVPEPVIMQPGDAIIRIIASSICGTDLHMIRGTLPGVKPDTILGHEAVGIVEKTGAELEKIKAGDRVVVCSTIACGKCVYCQVGEFSSCDLANPMGPEAGTAFFGGPVETGSFNGLQAERARIPFADTVLVKIPEGISNEDALLCSDIFPTGYMGAEIADVKAGDLVAVFGCGPVGQMAIASAKLMGARKVIAVDVIADRLAMAARQGAVTVNYDEQDPLDVLKKETNGYGPDACIDAVGVDAQSPHADGHKVTKTGSVENAKDRKMVAPKSVKFGDQWRQGEAPAQVLNWCVESVRKSGVVSIVGVYPQTMTSFPIGLAMQKALTIRAANCSHRKYMQKCFQIIKDGRFLPSSILTITEPFADAISAYQHFDKREPGWIKVELLPEPSK